MRFIDCDHSHAQAILAILNDAIVNTTALYDYKPRTMEMMAAWFEAKRRGAFPVIGVVAASGELMGFASYGTFRGWPAHKYTVEHSLYVAPQFRGRGLGTSLLQKTIERAQAQDYHVLVAGIDSANAASIKLHERAGFQRVGTMQQVGYKFGRWLDLCLYQLTLRTPDTPVEG